MKGDAGDRERTKEEGRRRRQRRRRKGKLRGITRRKHSRNQEEEI